jgi:hypothetical protein
VYLYKAHFLALDWFPGASFKQKGRNWAYYSLGLRDRPWEKFGESIVSDKICYG